METKQINVSQEFSKFPAGRYKKDGPYSGERFRKEFLVPALKNFSKVKVNLDGTYGYGSSFLNEAFGGLTREEGFNKKELKDKLLINSKNTSYIKEIWNYIESK